MISKQDFICRVKNEVFPSLVTDEKERKQTLLSGLVLIVPAFVSMLLFLYKYGADSPREILKIVALSFMGCCFYGAHIWDKFMQKQKNKYSPIFLNFLGNFQYGKNSIDRELLRSSCLFPVCEQLKNDDCFSGVLDGTEFSVSELDLLLEKKGKAYFRGFCIHIPLKNKLSDQTLIFNSKRPLNLIPLQQVVPEDINFAKNYKVYSNNQIEALMLLNPAFIKGLSTLKKCFYDSKIDIAFWENNVLFAIHTKNDLFESYSLFKPITDSKIYEKYYDEIKVICDIINILKITNK